MQEKEESKNKNIEKNLFYKKESSWLNFSENELKEIFELATEYKLFLDKSKTERTCILHVVDYLKKNNFKDLNSYNLIKKGDKFYKIIKDKCVICGICGENLNNFRLIGSHVDSPRLDLKPMPLYEDSELGLLQSHYYGGIKKYHWVNVPLSLNGVIFTKNGQKITLNIGENENDPKFIIPDLLPHLAKEQLKKEASKVIEGEELNIIFGHIPIKDDEIKEKIKLNILKKLNEEYNLTEEDFVFAELEFVPAQKSFDVGLDRGLIGGYGHDDRSCVFSSLKAICDINEDLKNTAISLFVDKEEIGSIGDTGASSFILLNFADEYVKKANLDIKPITILKQTKSISADVTVALDPNFSSVNDPKNSSYVGRGISIEKYGGAGGKYHTNDAHAEYMQEIREILDKNNIQWQTGELGKIDVGGGGTIAMFMSRYGMDCIDAGLCVLGTHSPCEVISKADLYSSYQFYKKFFKY
ncbi:MAG: aminopeptidase [Candidatus Woesearchaeota archaeon]